MALQDLLTRFHDNGQLVGGSGGQYYVLPFGSHQLDCSVAGARQGSRRRSLFGGRQDDRGLTRCALLGLWPCTISLPYTWLVLGRVRGIRTPNLVLASVFRSLQGGSIDGMIFILASPFQLADKMCMVLRCK